jgi:hypothetical protein
MFLMSANLFSIDGLDFGWVLIAALAAQTTQHKCTYVKDPQPVSVTSREKLPNIFVHLTPPGTDERAQLS